MLLLGVPVGGWGSSMHAPLLLGICEVDEALSTGWSGICFLCAFPPSPDKGRLGLLCLFLFRLREKEEAEAEELIEESDPHSTVDLARPLFLELEV